MLTALKEFVVTVKDISFLPEIYQEIEQEGSFGKTTIPSRSVKCVARRPNSRNTHYLLTKEEADALALDPRIESVTGKIIGLGVKTNLFATQTAVWSRSSSIEQAQKNWGLYRCQLENNIEGWGSETANGDTSATINLSLTGKNVDVVIVDDIAYPEHSEFESRFVQYNWFQHNAVVWPGNPNSSYQYYDNSPGDSYGSVNNHATHVAAVAAGKTQGWARDASIYNLRHDATSAVPGSYTPIDYVIDYIRAFHQNKPVNPATGRKNPTIVNNSWGLGVDLYESRNPYTGNVNTTISKISYRNGLIASSQSAVDTGISGICNATTKIANLVTVLNGANRIVTTGNSSGTVTSTTTTLNGVTGLSSAGEPTSISSGGVDTRDDAFWTISLPFNVEYVGQTYGPSGLSPNIHVSSNSFVTFGGSGSLAYILSAGTPPIAKIFASAGDRNCKDVYTGLLGTSPNRTFIVRWEGWEGTNSPYDDADSTMSWEMHFYENTPNQIDLIFGENAAYRGEFSPEELEQYGITLDGPPIPIRSAALDVDIFDAISEGIIFVGAAGDSNTKIDTPTGIDYDNYYISNGFKVYYNRGSSPSASHPDAICVGEVSSVSQEFKNQTSNAGPRVDVYAPGSDVISAVFDSSGNISNVVSDGSPTYSINTVAASGSTATIVTLNNHGLSNGDKVVITDCSNPLFNRGRVEVSVTGPNSFTFSLLPLTGLNVTTTTATGTVYTGFLYQKWKGTSVSCAQVTGLLATALEKYPWMKQADAKTYINVYAKSTVTDGPDGFSLLGGSNKFLFLHKERPESGISYPSNAEWVRPASGTVYPRPQIKRK